MVLKRLNYELFKSDFKPIYYSVNNEVYKYDTTIKIMEYPCVFTYMYKGCVIKIYVAENYPFSRPYKVYFDTFEYLILLTTFQCIINKQSDNRFIPKNINPIVYEDVHYLSKFMNCLCCNSILCEWSPMKTMKNIVEEVYLNFEIKMKPVWIIFASIIKRNYFSTCNIELELYL